MRREALTGLRRPRIGTLRRLRHAAPALRRRMHGIRAVGYRGLQWGAALVLHPVVLTASWLAVLALGVGWMTVVVIGATLAALVVRLADPPVLPPGAGRGGGGAVTAMPPPLARAVRRRMETGGIIGWPGPMAHAWWAAQATRLGTLGQLHQAAVDCPPDAPPVGLIRLSGCAPETIRDRWRPLPGMRWTIEVDPHAPDRLLVIAVLGMPPDVAIDVADGTIDDWGDERAAGRDDHPSRRRPAAPPAPDGAAPADAQDVLMTLLTGAPGVAGRPRATAGDGPAGDGPARGPAGDGPAGDGPARGPARGPAGDGPAGDGPAGDGPARGPAGDGPAGDGPARGPAGDGPAGDGPARGPAGASMGSGIAAPLRPIVATWLTASHRRSDGASPHLADASRAIQEVLREFRIDAEVLSRAVGPMVAVYQITPGAGVDVRRIVALERTLTVRIGRSVHIHTATADNGETFLSLEVPHPTPQGVGWGDLLRLQGAAAAPGALEVLPGVRADGSPLRIAIARAPHLLIAGATGSGKSTLLHAIIISLALRYAPQEVRLAILDPKGSLGRSYHALPHLVHPPACGAAAAAAALEALVGAMERRYAGGGGGPPLVVVVDEIADLVLTHPTARLQLFRLAQLGREAGMHLVLATQRPSVDVLPGVLKANIPVRIALRLPTATDSQVALDQPGAERLLGAGDLLLRTGDGIVRGHAALVDAPAVQAVQAAWAAVAAPPAAAHGPAAGGGAVGERYGVTVVVRPAARRQEVDGALIADQVQRGRRVILLGDPLEPERAGEGLPAGSVEEFGDRLDGLRAVYRAAQARQAGTAVILRDWERLMQQWGRLRLGSARAPTAAALGCAYLAYICRQRLPPVAVWVLCERQETLETLPAGVRTHGACLVPSPEGPDGGWTLEEAGRRTRVALPGTKGVAGCMVAT
jgi:hypothetical protein